MYGECCSRHEVPDNQPFHHKCINEWLRKSQNCPVCKGKWECWSMWRFDADHIKQANAHAERIWTHEGEKEKEKEKEATVNGQGEGKGRTGEGQGQGPGKGQGQEGESVGGRGGERGEEKAKEKGKGEEKGEERVEERVEGVEKETGIEIKKKRAREGTRFQGGFQGRPGEGTGNLRRSSRVVSGKTK